MSRPAQGELTVVAPPFLADLLARQPPDGVTLRLVAWDDGTLPPQAREPDVFVPWVTNRPATRKALSELPASAWVCSISSGVDWFADAVPPGVLVTSGRGLRSEACAEWVAAVALYLVRGLDTFAAHQRGRAWVPSCFGTLQDATVLLIGYGAIGRAVEDRLRPFGCTFLRVAAHPREGVHDRSKLASLLPRADVVVIAVPLTGATAGMADKNFIAAMRRGAVLVNVARGPIVHTTALVEAARRGHLRAALDVTEPEPLPADSPLFDTPGILVTPHIAGVVPGFDRHAHRFVADQIRRRARGLPLLNVQ